MKNYEYIVSACLAGKNCKYNGGNNACEAVISLVQQDRALAICPESLSGLPCPREPSERRGNEFVSRSGKNVTKEFEKGASLALKAALKSGAKKAVVKSRSPSCGYKKIYDGSFSGKLCNGNGLWTEHLLNNGFEIFTENDLPHDI